MSLSKQITSGPPRRIVPTAESEGFQVRGLTPAMCLGIYQRHHATIGSLFDDLAAQYGTGDDLTPEIVGDIINEVLASAPGIIAELVALAADGDPTSDDWPTDVMLASQLSVGVQVDALVKIFELTFTSDMPVGNFLGLLVRMVQKISGQPSGIPFRATA